MYELTRFKTIIGTEPGHDKKKSHSDLDTHGVFC